MKLAIVKLSALGDIIQSAFVLQFIKQKIPDCTIDWIVEEKFSDILKDNEDIDNIKTINLTGVKSNFFNIFSQIKKIRSFGPYEIIIDMQGLIKSALVARLLGKKTAGFDSNSARESAAALFYSKSFALPYTMHTSDRYRQLCAKALDIIISKQEIMNKKPYMVSQQLPNSLQLPQKYGIFIIGSTWQSRCYPKENFLQIAKNLPIDIFIPYGNEQEYDFATYLHKNSSNCHLLPKMNLLELKSVISKAALVVGNDTGPTYIGWANNTPTILLFGPTPPVRVYENDTTVLLKSPSHVDPLTLNKDDFSINQISTQEVLNSIHKVTNEVFLSP